MLKDSLNELKNIFGNNENLIYQLAYNEFKNIFYLKLKTVKEKFIIIFQN